MSANPLFFKPVNLHPLVLIVESDEDTRLMMKYLLQMWKYAVIEAADDGDALEMAALQQPDLILLSGRIQSADSFTTIKRIREVSLFDKTEIIYISAYSEPAVRASALAAGADNFLVKPIDFGHLEEMLQNHLNPPPQRREMFL